MTPQRIFELAEHLWPNEPFGLTRDELEDIAESAFGDRHYYRARIAAGDHLTMVGYPVVELPDDWMEAQ